MAKEREIAARLQRSQPKFWRRVKIGTIAGIVVGLIAAGYEANFVESWLSSKAAQKQIAIELNIAKDRDAGRIKPRSIVDRLLGRNKPPKQPKVSVGKTWLTKHDAKGRITSVGKVAVIKGMPGQFRATPKVPLSKRTAKFAAYGAGAGAAFGVASYARSKWGRRKRRP